MTVLMSSVIESTSLCPENNSVTLLTQPAKTKNRWQSLKRMNSHSIIRLGSAARFPNVIMIRGPAASGDKLRIQEAPFSGERVLRLLRIPVYQKNGVSR